MNISIEKARELIAIAWDYGHTCAHMHPELDHEAIEQEKADQLALLDRELAYVK